MRKGFFAAFAGVAVGAMTLGGCGGGPDTGAEVQSSSGSAAQSGAASGAGDVTLTVFAAASMEPTFTELAPTFEKDHPGVKVVFNFAGSQTLQEQIIQGAPADVFASANQKQMDPVVAAGLNAGTPTVYATNELEIVVPPDNPAGITSLRDLTKDGLKLVICAPEVPCGSATQSIVKATGIVLAPVSEEQSVTDVLGKVQTGEADAGLVYKTDVIAAGDTVLGIPFPESAEAVNKNPIVALTGGPEPKLGQAWVDFILSADVQKTLADAGFGPAD